MTPGLTVSRVQKAYGGHAVLREVGFTAGCGEVVGVVGPNGAGKTTLLRIVAGLVRATAGCVHLDARPTTTPDARHGISYFAGESTVPPAVRSRPWRGLFHDVDGRLDNVPVRLLSRGMRQLLGLRTLFALSALRLIVLDEPWEGLDPDASRWLTASVRARSEGNSTVLVSSHRLHDMAGVCHRYIFLDDGVSTSVDASQLTDRGRVTGETLLAAFDSIRGGVP